MHLSYKQPKEYAVRYIQPGEHQMELIVLTHFKLILSIACFSKPHLEVHPSLPPPKFTNLLGADSQKP